MAKDKHAKEVARARRKKEQKLRDAQRKRNERQTVGLMLEGLAAGTARGMAAYMSQDFSSGREIGREVPVPSYYGDFLAKLSQCGLRAELDALIEALMRTELHLEGSLAPGISICLTAYGWEFVPLPTCLLTGSTNPREWLEMTVGGFPGAELVLWLTWMGGGDGNSMPNVCAIDSDGRLAVWLLDGDRRWFAVSRPEAYFANHAESPMDPACWSEAGISQVFEHLGVDLSPSCKVKAADPRVGDAVGIVAAAQQPILDALVEMSRWNHEGERLLGALASENDKIGRMEQEVAALQRRLTKTEQERDAARALLAKGKAVQHGQPKVVQVTLGDRVAQIFAEIPGAKRSQREPTS